MNTPQHFPARQRRFLCAAALALTPLLGHAGITDPAGDFLPTFAGSTSSADLDVLAASAVFDPSTDTFTLSGTMNGAPGTTPGGFYVWGVDTGTGTASFAANGLPNIEFNQVVLVHPTGTSLVPGSGNLAPGAVTVNGNTITAVVSGALLHSTGFAEAAYTWNLWPRDGNVAAGFTQISDFAPDSSNFATTLAVPEPETYVLMLAGLGVVGWAAKRRRA